MIKRLSTLKYYWRAARPSAHPMIAFPLLSGQALASVSSGSLSWRWFLVILLFGGVCQPMILYLNDYADEAVDRHSEPSWLAGGSRVIPDGQLTGGDLLSASFFLMALLMALSVCCIYFERPWMPLLAGLCIIAAWTYSLAPLKSAYRGHGEFHQALSCGVLLPVIGFYLQTGMLVEDFPWTMLLPLCAIFFAGNIVTALPDVPADQLHAKQSYPVRHGVGRAGRDIIVLLMGAYVAAIVLGAPQVWLPTMLLAAAPAIILLVPLFQLVFGSEAAMATRAGIRRFTVFASLSQAWMLAAWTAILFWQGCFLNPVQT